MEGVFSLIYLTSFKIVEKIQIWRLLTAPFYNPQLLMLACGLISYLPMASIKEKMGGTSRSLLEFLINTMIISILFTVLGLMLYDYGMYHFPLLGLWPLVMMEMVLDCYRDPEVSRSLCCLPIKCKSKYFPWIFLVVLILLAP
jgi:membrane associated rhomboid family serine protease